MKKKCEQEKILWKASTLLHCLLVCSCYIIKWPIVLVYLYCHYRSVRLKIPETRRTHACTVVPRITVIKLAVAIRVINIALQNVSSVEDTKSHDRGPFYFPDIIDTIAPKGFST